MLSNADILGYNAVFDCFAMEILMSANLDFVVIQPHDLPLHCSGSQTDAWNGHPRVFLPIESNSSIECPYCGTRYRLDGEVGKHH